MSIKWISIGVGVLAAVFLLSWLFLRPTSITPTQNTTGEFGSGNTQTNVGTENNTNPTDTGGSAESQKIFRIANGPVAGATFIQTLNPTTTIARYVMAENGRVFDLPVDSPGAVPKSISNTTIPGVTKVVWTKQGSGPILQYISDGVIKSVNLSLPTGTSTQVRLQFLPNNIADLAASPDGASIAYLMRTESGSDVYVSDPNGGAAKK
jgi:hypothetical protein